MKIKCYIASVASDKSVRSTVAQISASFLSDSKWLKNMPHFGVIIRLASHQLRAQQLIII